MRRRPDRYDVIVVGAGLAGLSLAARLAGLTAGEWGDRSVLLIGDDLDDLDDQGRGRGGRAACWAFWAAERDLLDAAVSRTYRQVMVHAGGASRVVPLGRYTYRLTRRSDLRRVVTSLLAGRPGFTSRHGHVTEVRTVGDTAVVVADGETFEADWVFDSRYDAPGGAAGVPDAWMAVAGWEVACPAPVFEPRLPTLMDFRVEQVGGACFGYVLPVTAHRAFVEYTTFVPRTGHPPTQPAARRALAGYLAEVLDAGEYEILGSETAVMPLRTTPVERVAGRTVAIGARGGLVKASSGYAYGRIQRDSAAIVASLARHGHPLELPVAARRHRWLDAVLLDVLAADPASLQRAFARLFAGNPAERVLRLLDEDSSPVDDVRLAATVAAIPFGRAAIARAARAAGRALRYGAGRTSQRGR